MSTFLLRGNYRSRSAWLRRAEQIVTRWTRWYTRGLDADVTRDRQDELASDLWEQQAAAARFGQKASATAVSLLWRTVRGIPSDLSWRRQQALAVPGSRPRALARGWTSGRGSLATAFVLTLGVIAFGTGAIARLLIAISRRDFLPSDTTMWSTALGTIVVICGLVLLARAKTRWIGAGWIGLGTVAVLHFGSKVFITLSVTTNAIYAATLRTGSPLPALLGNLTVVAIGIFFATLAIAWSPRTTSAKKHQ